jgi:hypothetical protein
MGILISLIVGFILGLVIHMLMMKISFKQRTIDNKIKVYDSIITSWVKMRNQIFSLDNTSEKWHRLDQMYGESQTYIGEIFLVTENDSLAMKINTFNEKFFRQHWHTLDLNVTNQTIESLKDEGLILVAEMREDIRESTVLTRQDIFHIWSGLKYNKKPV